MDIRHDDTTPWLGRCVILLIYTSGSDVHDSRGGFIVINHNVMGDWECRGGAFIPS